MARAIDDEIIRLSGDISLVRVVETSGLALSKRGPDHVGRCPFHDDDGSSLRISTDNRWLCTVCEAGGDVIDWVVRRNGVSRHHAIQLLKEGLPEALTAPEPVKISTVRRLSCPVNVEADDQALLGQVVGFYHDALKQSPEGLGFLQAKGLVRSRDTHHFHRRE